jgi:hypothetical protein
MDGALVGTVAIKHTLFLGRIAGRNEKEEEGSSTLKSHKSFK